MIRVLFVCILAAPIVSADAVDPQPLRLFILSGQSNMERLDPDISFTPALRAAFPDDELMVVKDALGGQPIRRWYKGWEPAAGKRTQVPGDLYDRLLEKVSRGVETRKPDTVVFVWMQGERDTREGYAQVYAAALRGLIRQLETDLNRSDVFVVIGRLSDYGNENPDRPQWEIVRKAQVEVAGENPRWAWVDTDDLNGPDNKLHYTSEGYRRLGERFAASAVTLIQTADPIAASPDAPDPSTSEQRAPIFP